MVRSVRVNNTANHFYNNQIQSSQLVQQYIYISWCGAVYSFILSCPSEAQSCRLNLYKKVLVHKCIKNGLFEWSV